MCRVVRNHKKPTTHQTRPSVTAKHTQAGQERKVGTLKAWRTEGANDTGSQETWILVLALPPDTCAVPESHLQTHTPLSNRSPLNSAGSQIPKPRFRQVPYIIPDLKEGLLQDEEEFVENRKVTADKENDRVKDRETGMSPVSSET